ncbi:hypothetical protein Ccrd_001465 [Cynara cardunculus var. scolymus]|uniref:Uncharacterized protein n=1 Tax=Cynara cardunculus var. scolymus TaxID=59895 RepID=A0A118JXK2_CYNCS|nr:hypothetical protein Ccrd_001465 [Cynara cardunculus var. scolymus]
MLVVEELIILLHSRNCSNKIDGRPEDTFQRRNSIMVVNYPPFAPRNTTSFLIRAKKAEAITPLVSPCPVTPVVLPTPNFSPSREVLVDIAKEEWGVDGYGFMKGSIRLRLPGNEADVAEDEEDEEGGSSESDVDKHLESLERQRRGAQVFIEEVVENDSEHESESRGYGRSMKENMEENNEGNQYAEAMKDSVADVDIEDDILRKEENINVDLGAKMEDDDGTIEVNPDSSKVEGFVPVKDETVAGRDRVRDDDEVGCMCSSSKSQITKQITLPISSTSPNSNGSSTPSTPNSSNNSSSSSAYDHTPKNSLKYSYKFARSPKKIIASMERFARSFSTWGSFSTREWVANKIGCCKEHHQLPSLLLNRPPPFKLSMHTTRVLFHNLMTDGLILTIWLAETTKKNVSIFINNNILHVTVVMLAKSEANILHYHVMLPSHIYKHSDVKAAYIHGALNVCFRNIKEMKKHNYSNKEDVIDEDTHILLCGFGQPNCENQPIGCNITKQDTRCMHRWFKWWSVEELAGNGIMLLATSSFWGKNSGKSFECIEHAT